MALIDEPRDFSVKLTKLCSARVAGIHRDKHADLILERELHITGEIKEAGTPFDGIQHGFDLYRAYREDFRRDSIEFIEASPGAAGGEAFEDVT